MTRLFPTRVLIGLIFFILIVQAAALHWHLYFYFWWLDIPMHILGGLWTTLFGLSVFLTFLKSGREAPTALLVVSFALALTLSVGLLWEIYEFGVDRAVGDSGAGLADTLKDLVDDVIGALIGSLIFIRGGYVKSAMI